MAALSCAEKDGFVEVSLHGENNYTESARYILDCEGVVWTLKRQIAEQYAGKITGEVPGYITTFQTTNAIEGFNCQLRKVTKSKTIFPTDDILLKMLYPPLKQLFTYLISDFEFTQNLKRFPKGPILMKIFLVLNVKNREHRVDIFTLCSLK